MRQESAEDVQDVETVQTSCDEQACDGLDEDQCVASMDALVNAMDDATRLNVQMQFMGADKICDSAAPR